MSTRWKFALLGASCFAVLLAACGGGGGGGGGAAVQLPLMQLNDTGISADQCFAAGSTAFVACSSPQARALSATQDGQLGRDAVATTNSNSDGKLGFQFSAVPGGCVHDEVTGLTWESKTADGGLRDGTLGYTKYGDGRPGDATEFVAAVNLAGLCGAADWRLPTLQELYSVFDFGAMYDAPPFIDQTWFPNTRQAHYWTSDQFPSIFGRSPGRYWIRFYRVGLQVSEGQPDQTYGVRLVRGGNVLVPADTRFSPSADAQEVTDAQTGLIWRRCAEGTQFLAGSCTGTFMYVSHEEAMRLATTRAAAAGVGWRLPNAKELLSLTQTGRFPARDMVAFPETLASNGFGRWASTSCGNGAAAFSDFESSGTISCLARVIKSGGVQLVRDPS